MKKELNKNLTEFKIRQIMSDNGWKSEDSFGKDSKGEYFYRILFKKYVTDTQVISHNGNTKDIYEIDKLTFEVATKCLEEEKEFNTKLKVSKPTTLPLGWSKSGIPMSGKSATVIKPSTSIPTTTPDTDTDFSAIPF